MKTQIFAAVQVFLINHFYMKYKEPNDRKK